MTPISANPSPTSPQGSLQASSCVCGRHPLFAARKITVAPNLPHESNSTRSGSCGVPGCWHNTPAPGTPPPSPPIDVVKAAPADSSGRAVKESSGPEARETPRSPLLVNNGQSSITEWGKKQRRQFQRLMTLLYRWEVMGLSIIRLDLTTAVGGDAEKLTNHYETLRRRIEKKIGK